jgi:hypothetical protein
MDEKALLRRFNLRCLLVAGMLIGGMPFIMTPVVLRGMSEAYPNLYAAIFNGLTVLPASALAFWHRRIACIWLSLNAIILVVAWAGMTHTGREFHIGGLLGMCGSIGLALCLDYMELRRWPGALGD